MIFRAVDFEMIGPEDDSEVVEIGWCDVEEGAIGRPRFVLLKHEKQIDVETMAIHHLQEKHFEDAVHADQGFEGLRGPEKAGEQVIYVAHSAKAEQAKWPAPVDQAKWLCTYKCALRLYPDAPRHSLQVLRYYLGLFDLPEALALPAHRAAPDAFVTANILVEMMHAAPLDQLLEWSAQPALLPRITFSHNRGMKWSEINEGFLYWVLERDFNEDVMHTARTELDRRKALRETAEELDDSNGEPF